MSPYEERINNMFIEWGSRKAKNRLYVNWLALKAVVKLLVHVNKPKFPAVLHDKIVRGGKEHGAPIYPLSKIRKEISDELTDLIGWQLIEVFNKNERKRKN